MKDDKRLKRKVRNSYAVSTLSIALVLFLAGSVGYLIYSLFGVTDSLRDSITATVELKEEVGEGERAEIRAQIAKMEIVGNIDYISRDDKLQDAEFRKLFGSDIESVLESNPLLDSFEVQLLSISADGNAIGDFISGVEAIEGVDGVYYPAMLAERVHSTLSTMQLVLLLFGATLLFVSLVLLNNTIRLAIYSRRYIINTMKLVGATRWFIIRPLMWSGVKSGFAAGAIASALFFSSAYALGVSLPELMTLSNMNLLLSVVGIIIASGVIISLIFTIFAANKFVNIKSNKIYLY